jgi:hypothetical protein
LLLTERPFNLKGGTGFFLKKYCDSQCCWKKYSDFGGGKTINLIQRFCHKEINRNVENKVVFGDFESDLFEQEYGVKQGCVLYPALFRY